MEQKKFNLEQYRREMEPFIGTSPATRLFYEALDFAFTAHAGQMRKSGDPYIIHPCATARILAEELDVHNAEILAAGLLHDTIEDVEEVTPEVLREKFGSNVEVIVVGCTKVKHHSGDKQALKKLVHRKLFTGAAAKPEVMIVKLADRLHNLRTLGSMPRHKRQRIAEETLDFYAPLATILGLFALKRELYTLALANKFPKQGHKLKLQINRLKNNPALLSLIAKIQNALDQIGVSAEVSVRTKDLWGYYDVKNRVLRKELEVPQEILITLDNRSSCYQALGTLNEIYPPVPRTIRDFIANPKPTGYQGLHARAIVEGNKYLFKIRTEGMARRAQRGLVKDWNPNDNRKQDRFLCEIQEMFDILGTNDGISYRDMIAAGGRKEIYTYTPNGDLICLPVKSVVLDFAFRIHTEIGHSCIGAIIGNNKAQPGGVLEDGSVVEVLRQDTPVHFDLEMQTKCQTPRARSELTKAFRERIQKVSKHTGQAVLEQEMRRYGLSFDLIDHPGMENILAYFNITSKDELLQRVGQGRIRMRELIYEIRSGLYRKNNDLLLHQPTGSFNRIELTTVDPVVVKSSACCRPTPLDKGLVGLLSIRGISLHCKDCFQLKKLKFQREDAVEVRWKLGSTKITKPQKFIVANTGATYLFRQLSAAPKEMSMVTVLRVGGNPETALYAWEVHFTVATLRALKRIIRHLNRSFTRYAFDFKQ
ncbi:MAG: bifunctional (p)ppGpp synthetase/guanosine-3',5'-bis(diphosphate) 3'-pyrophosphohydrolase [Candidatus Electrothrix sp. AR3]|nr:bifunctional (p)ppGpp synthetase/guanosine-3',5'-bis(diphosphate) 3'-pyrophosphohydrolase [Candidatus Electrothrix sp. AR3]